MMSVTSAFCMGAYSDVVIVRILMMERTKKMAREGLFDDSGYRGFDECSRYDDCCEDAYREGARDFAKWLIDKHVDNYSDVVNLVKEFVEG